MTAEEIFIDWLRKQEFWVKKLYYVLSINSEVAEDDIQDIIDNYIQQKFDKIDIVMNGEKNERISLKKVYHVKGVNRLVPEQEIVFGDNLTR